MTKIWLKLQLHFSQKTTTKTKLKSAVKINTAVVDRRSHKNDPHSLQTKWCTLPVQLPVNSFKDTAFWKCYSAKYFFRLDTDAGREGLAHNHSNMFNGVEGVPHQTHPTTSLWTLLCALGHSHAGIEKALPQTVPTTLEAYYCPKCIFASSEIRGLA